VNLTLERYANSFFQNELIGRHVRVLNWNIEGMIVDETKNSFLIKTKEKIRKRILKANNEFEFKHLNGDIIINGNTILMRPDERIKKTRK
jgi:RNase P/RNase MRP subunit p29